MNKDFIYVVSVALVLFLISGCETVPKKFKEEVLGIKTRVETLESRVEGVETKQVDVERVTSEQTQAIEELKESAREKLAKKRVSSNISVKPRRYKSNERIKDIQICLKNAGFYTGKVDGVKGKGTRRAIKEFQKANGLKPDGVVGMKTWALLSKHLSTASARSVAAVEEGVSK